MGADSLAHGTGQVNPIIAFGDAEAVDCFHVVDQIPRACFSSDGGSEVATILQDPPTWLRAVNPNTIGDL